jgi:S-DNA-T family DNA segregation ATPase FtsK/SpoIIIE
MARGRNIVSGEQLAQVDNRDPFAPPVWRSPVYRTPEPVIWLVQLIRLTWRILWFALTHPLLDAVAALAVVTWLGLGWPGVVGLVLLTAAGLGGLRVIQPVWFARWVAVPVRDWWRWWFYRRRWKAAMTLAGLAPDYQRQPMLPVLAGVHRAGTVDLVRVGLVTGQAPADFADRAENLAHAFRARLCRIRDLAPGVIMLELVRSDTLADPVPALPVTGEVDLARLPVGRCEDGTPWRLRLLSTHVLIAGATGSGKGSVIWSLIRALLPAIEGGWVQVWALDPKRMELSFGRALFHRYACQASRHGRPPGSRRHRDARPRGAVWRPDPHLPPLGRVPVPGRPGGRARVPDRLPARTRPPQAR